MELLETLRLRNDVLFWFGAANFLAALLFIVLSGVNSITFKSVNAWYKPVKFALSIGILSWTMGWYMGYLEKSGDLDWASWVMVVTLAFEVIYIAFQASKGEASHYNLSTPIYAALYALMALGASAATLAVGYIGIKFFAEPLPDLPAHYLWAIRLGILLFVIFSFEGFLMGSRLAHTIGAPDGSKGLPFLNWSLTHGDLRVAHFIGMHALQVLPLLAWYVLKDVRLTFGAFVGYAALASLILLQALKGNPVG
ncbi:MAG: hypothetical protein KI786_16130 [Mameliella sp.]|nr:hypothetical protein [Phaeodactylibacter sp.]